MSNIMLQLITFPKHTQVGHSHLVQGMGVGVVVIVQMTCVLMHTGVRA
jgi:hypothetical protein